jgi:hypothetical protein
MGEWSRHIEHTQKMRIRKERSKTESDRIGKDTYKLLFHKGPTGDPGFRILGVDTEATRPKHKR